MVDSQTIKAPHVPGGGGYETAKKVKGRKRHVVVDTDGRLLMVNLTTANVQDAAGAEAIVKAMALCSVSSSLTAKCTERERRPMATNK